MGVAKSVRKIGDVILEQRHLDAAKAYLWGPEGIQGNWRAACKSSGFTRAPAKDTKVAQVAIEEAKADRALDGEDAKPAAIQDLEELLAGTFSWEEAAPVAQKVLVQIGAGLVPASSGQVAALKELVARAEGRIGDRSTGERPIGVVVLPALVDQDRLPYIEPEDMRARESGNA